MQAQLALNNSAARALHLHAQGLLHKPARKASKATVLASIRQMAALQIDTISVVARSPYLVLWSRLGAYDKLWLDELLAEGELFEYWSHEACFLPIADYPLYRHRMLNPAAGSWKYNLRWMEQHPEVVNKVRDYIRQHGATRSMDFVHEQKREAGWWEWKPEKRALEVLFSLGELMVARRQGFQRVYDLQQRVLPDWSDQRDLPQLEDCLRQQVLLSVKALGCSTSAWISDYFRMNKLQGQHHPQQLAQSAQLISIRLQDDQGSWHPAWLHPDHLEAATLAAAGKLKPSVTRILSPFDPVVWDRKRALQLFGFDYRLECYTPAAKRQHGYFCLPVLRNGQLIGRLDAKAHRKSGHVELISWHAEAGLRRSEAMYRDLATCVHEFANWHDCPELRCSSQIEPDFKRALQA